MAKLTPIDVLAGSLIQGDFRKVELEEHIHPDTIYPQYSLAPIDTHKFGDIFTKCVGELNSVIKRGPPATDDNPIQFVVKKFVGYTGKVAGKPPVSNARYAYNKNIFNILHPNHIPLICKADKRAMVQDFMDLKAEIIMKFHNLKVLASEYVSETIVVSDAFVVSHKPPSYFGDSTVSGYMLLNGRIIPKSSVRISISDQFNNFAHYSVSVDGDLKREMDGLMIITIFINELCEKACNTDPDVYKDTTLFRVTLMGSDVGNIKHSAKVFDTQFNGINVDGMIKALLEGITELKNDFDKMLDAIKDKYHGEYLLSIICDGDHESAI